jgi:hypothetical protein
MKKTLFVIFLLSATAAFAQYGGVGTLNPQVQSYQFVSHPAHAAFSGMAQELSDLASASYGSAQGERPVSDFPQAKEVSLGAAARELRKQHDAQLKKSHIVWVNQ